MVKDLKGNVTASWGVRGFMLKTFAHRRCMRLAFRHVPQTFAHHRSVYRVAVAKFGFSLMLALFGYGYSLISYFFG